MSFNLSHRMKIGFLSTLTVVAAAGAAFAANGWDAYLAPITHAPGVAGGAIIGKDGSVWADKGTGVSRSEGPVLATGMNNPSKFQSTGITVGGTKYMFVNQNGNVVVGRKGAVTVVLVPSSRAIVVGVTTPAGQPGTLSVAATALADTLKKNNF